MPKLDLERTVDRIYESYEERRADKGPRAAKGFREHLGGSVIGKECERAIWYSFRWALPVTFPGRILRLFETGELEEPRIVDDLRRVGVEVFEENPFEPGEQIRVSLIEDHFGGSLDGIVRGLFEAPKSPHTFECKTANAKSSRRLEQHGMRKAKPRHFDQVTTYMGAWNELVAEIRKLADQGEPEDLSPFQSFVLSIGRIERAFYVSKNKDNDELYTERVALDADRYKAIKRKARRIIDADEPPERISDDPTFYKCGWCDFSEICHRRTMPSANCRTCAHSTPLTEPGSGGGWVCEVDRYPVEIDVDEQFAGCARHVFLPTMVPLDITGADGEGSPDWISYGLPDGRTLLNVTPDGMKAAKRETATAYFEGPYSSPDEAEKALAEERIAATSYELAEKPIKLRDGRAILEIEGGDPC